MKDELGGKITIKFAKLRAKTYNYFIDDVSEDKKAKGTKKSVIKRKLKFENYKNCLEATQLENKIKHLAKSEVNIDSFFCYKRNHKEFIKNKIIFTKTQQRSKNERHNVFTEEINKIVLSINDNKRTQSIRSIEAYAYGTTKNLVSEKEKRND